MTPLFVQLLPLLGTILVTFVALYYFGEQQRKRQARQQNDILLRMSSEVASFGGWSLHPARMDLSLTSGAHKILGTDSHASVPFAKLTKLCEDQSRIAVEQAMRACTENGTPFNLTLDIIATDNEQRRMRMIGAPQYDANGDVIRINGALQDITELKRAEDTARNLTTQLFTTMESITDGLCTLDKDWRFTYVNPAAERIFNMPLKTMAGRIITDVFVPVPGRPLTSVFDRAVETQSKQEVEHYSPALGRWLYIHVYPRGEGVALYFQDVSEKHALEEKLQRAQRLEAVGQLTGGVAHDFNNLLTVIAGNAEMLIEGLPQGSVLHQCASATHLAAERGAELTGRLLAFSRKQNLEPQALDLNDLVRETRTILHKLLGEHIDFRHVEKHDIWRAEIDKGQFENAIINLCVNARDAMPDGGTLTIAMENVNIDATTAGEAEEFHEGDYVMVSVHDNGTGMDADVLKHVFEPFFTTKDVGKGSGLGLSMVYGFAKQSGGHVKALSTLGEGTEIQLFLPRAVQAADEIVTEANDNQRPTGSETILVVEDDELVRGFVAEQLEALGYKVSLATNGTEALKLVERSDTFDLLFTDIVMPGKINGHQLAQEVHKTRPHMKVLFTTGYADGIDISDEGLEPNVHVLNKPYRRDDLAVKIRTALSSAN